MSKPQPIFDLEQLRIMWLLLSTELFKLEEDPHGMTYMISQVRSAKEEIEIYFKLMGASIE